MFKKTLAHIPMLSGMSCWNFKNNWPVVIEFLRPQENVTPYTGRQPPDSILARLKSSFPYWRRIKRETTPLPLLQPPQNRITNGSGWSTHQLDLSACFPVPSGRQWYQRMSRTSASSRLPFVQICSFWRQYVCDSHWPVFDQALFQV